MVRPTTRHSPVSEASKTVSSFKETTGFTKCHLGSHNLGSSRLTSTSSHPRGRGKGRRLVERNDRSAAACAARTHSYLSRTPHSLTMPLLGWSLAAPRTHPNPSRVVNKVLSRQGFECLVYSIRHHRFPSGRSRHHTPHYHLSKHPYYRPL